MNNRPAIGMGALAIGAVGLLGNVIGAVAYIVASARDPYGEHPMGTPILIGMGATTAVIAAGMLILDSLRGEEENLGERTLATITDEFRAQRASSSSSDAPAFNWSQSRLFVNRAGGDVGQEVAKFLNRILRFIEDSPRKSADQTAASYSQMNEYLDSLERDPALRKQLAESVENLNGACLNRNTQGINAIIQKLRRLQYQTMPFKEFMLNAMADMANNAVELEIFNRLKKDVVVEVYQAVEGDVLRNLREKFPGLPYQFEGVHQFHGEVKLTSAERQEIAQKIVKKVTDPKEFAYFLQNCVEANASMEGRFADVLERENVNVILSNENLENGYQNFAEEHNKKVSDLELDEMNIVEMKLKEEKDKKVQEVYAKVIKDFLLGRQDGAGTSQAMEPKSKSV